MVSHTMSKKARVLGLTALAAVLCVAVLAFAGCSSSSSSSAASTSGSASATSASATAASGSASAASAGATSASASAASTSASAAAADMRTFTDSCGRTVEIPKTINKIAASGTTAQMVLLSIAPDQMVGLTNALNEGELKYLGSKLADLPVFGQIYGGKGNFNKEAIAAAGPQLIIDVGEAKKGIESDLDELQQQIGIPCVHIEATLDTFDQAYALLGELLGKQDRAKELGDYFAKVYTDTKAVIDAVPADQRVKVSYLLGDAGLNTLAKGTYQAAIIDMCADNVSVVENAKGGGMGSEISFEQLALWNPDMIVFGPGSVYAAVGEDASWQSLDAVKNHNYFEVPGEPYNWMSQPASINQLMGLQWFARLCYPDQFQTSISDVAKEYYKVVLGSELSDADVAALVANAVRQA